MRGVLRPGGWVYPMTVSVSGTCRPADLEQATQAAAGAARPQGENMTRSRLALPLLVLALLAAALPARAEKWVLLGQRHVSDRAEHDTIEVTASEGSFDAVQLRVKRSSVRFYEVKVVYGAGTSDELEVRDVIPAGGQSRVLDLRGANRFVKRVEFRYEAKTLGRRGAIVELWGRR